MAYDERYPLKEYLNSINVNKNNLMDEDSDPAWESNYPSYVINKCMSHHMDTVMSVSYTHLTLPTKRIV